MDPDPRLTAIRALVAKWRACGLNLGPWRGRDTATMRRCADELASALAVEASPSLSSDALLVAVRTVYDKFLEDERQGYRSRDRQYAIEILGRVLAVEASPRAADNSRAQEATTVLLSTHVRCCRFHPTDGWHEVGCPHRPWSDDELRHAGYGHLLDRAVAASPRAEQT
jgi:hypothetical protein